MDGGAQSGTVKWFSIEKGYGFIAPVGGGPDLFVHCNDVDSRLFPCEGQKVSYVPGQDSSGRKCAVNVKVL
jgi:cold shock protein